MESRTTKLHQLIAVAQGVRAAATSALTTTYRDIFQKRAPDFTGHSKVYTPKEEGGDPLPPENRTVQFRVEQILEQMRESTQKFWDCAASIEATNAFARSDVYVGDKLILSAVPVTVLLFLEKRLNDLETLLTSIPTLDIDKTWIWDANTNLHTSPPITTNRNVDTFKSFSIAPATPQHKEQAELHKVPVFVGTWTTTHLSGAMTPARKEELLQRVRQLRSAVVLAREDANSAIVREFPIHEPVMKYIFD